MNQLTFIDKIQVLFKLLFSSPVIIGIFVFSMALMILLFFYSKLNKKILKIVFIALYVLIIGFAVVKYGSYFLTSIDSFITLFMANIYFPILPVYVLIMLVSFVIMTFTLNSNSGHKVVKIINTVFFTLIQMLFALFIYIIESNKIDLSSNNNLYSNEQTLTLLELGMGLFFVWIFVLLVILYLKKADKIFRVKNDDGVDDFDEYINDYNEPSTIVSMSNQSVNIDNTPKVSDLVSSTNFNNNFVFDDSVNNAYESSSNGINNNLVSSYDDFSNGFSQSYTPGFNNVVDSVNNVQGIVPSFQNSSNEEVVNFDIFSNDFKDIPSNNSFSKSDIELERKHDDVEIIDFDI